MPFRTIPNTDIRYTLINFDDRGRERADDLEDGMFRRTVQEHIRQTNPSDIFVFNHEWKGDVPGAIEQYDRWIAVMWKLQVDRMFRLGSLQRGSFWTRRREPGPTAFAQLRCASAVRRSLGGGGKDQAYTREIV